MGAIFILLFFTAIIAAENCLISAFNYTNAYLRSQTGFLWPKRPKNKARGKWLYQQQHDFGSAPGGYINPRCMEAMNRTALKQYPLWGYDKKTKKCIQYHYKKCGDTFSGNRFDTKEDCEDTCRYYDYDE